MLHKPDGADLELLSRVTPSLARRTTSLAAVSEVLCCGTAYGRIQAHVHHAVITAVVRERCECDL